MLAFEFDSDITMFLVIDDVPSGAKTSMILMDSSILTFFGIYTKIPESKQDNSKARNLSSV